MEYIFTEVFSQQPPEISQYLVNTAILDRFCSPLCEAVCVHGVEPFTREIGGWEYISWLIKENMFLIPLDAQNRWFRFHHLFQKLLLNQLKRHLSPEDINALHAQASAWFAENGLMEEALKHALAGNNPVTAARLIAQHGFNLLNDEEWPRLERWLRMLPGDMIGQDPELLLLVSWLHVIYARYAELGSCLDKAEALFSARTTAEHIQGHLDALRGFEQFLAANGERTLTWTRRACENIPRKHRWARVFAFIIQAGAHQMLGDREKALSTIKEAMRDPDLGGGISQGYFQANPCFIYWMEADLTAMLQTAARSLRVAEECRVHQAIAHGLHFIGIAHYHRNELQAAEAKLVVVVKDRYSQHAWNFAHSAFALALIYQARGRTDEANQVGESVVSYALDTNNPVVLRVARAFQAELALRQGRLAEASHWASQFVAKPFVTMYRFYVPQLTLVRVLLAQDTMESREQAADLLKQLYDFVVSTHNTRFRIEMLALQAILHSSQRDEPAALKTLGEALTLAEPGGFIRLFADLGPPMADLLKRLVSQNVAVRYIGRILAAFSSDERGAAVDESDHTVAHPSDLSIQPLVEPLTNRELQILELLAQRLRNKEIAAKLFISAETVKKHLNTIYRKLNVTRRLQAVEKAHTLGILMRR
jgi:LuxR family maltose regulon positive regulatory protein